MENALGGRVACTSHPKNGRGRRTKDEKDSELTLNRDKPWAKLSCLFGAQTSATCRARPRQFVTEQVSTSLAPNEVNAGE